MVNMDIVSFPKPDATRTTSHRADSKAEIEMVENAGYELSNVVQPAALM